MRTSKEAIERFLEKVVVDEKTGCHVWTGAVMTKGYGSFFVRREGPRRINALAHRWAYENIGGNALSRELVIDHLCRNRLCVNVAHLELVTTRTNNLRGIGWSAKNAVKTHCPIGHELAGENLVARKDGKRNCKACFKVQRRASDKRRYEKLKAASEAQRGYAT